MFISYAHEPECEDHRAAVRELADFLRSQGIDAHLDQDVADQRVDWTLWMGDQISKADHVLVIASPAYRVRAQGQAGPDEGRGVQWEARLIRDAFYAAQDALDRFVPVVLPGQSVDGVPDFLAPASTTVYHVRECTIVGAEPLLRMLTRQPAHTPRPLGTLPVLPPEPLRYHEQVKRIAPAQLLDREPELAALATFCVDPSTAGTYWWWRAGAWAGKSALMSRFVLAPPAGVRVVSFFVTARLADQSDRVAFIDNLMDQLHTVLGRTPSPLTAAIREAHLLSLLAEAAAVCEARGEQFVLLVDGLDEDRGVPAGHSIAALLPANPPAGMRVVVASRPDPPIPGDVPAHHPLRTGAQVTALEPSKHAARIRDLCEQELVTLLTGTPAEKDLLGLMAAAGGGLSAADLAHLTGSAEWEIKRRLHGVTGRSFRRSGTDAYLLGHEELQVMAQEMLGPELSVYRERLHAWAKGYRERQWPSDTPEFLLRGYFRMLTTSDGLARMVGCATDPARRERMLQATGSDAAALAEITTALETVAVQDEPDLVTMARLAVHRDHVSGRNANTPADLPAAWARIGRTEKAESVANSITDLRSRARALSLVAVSCAESGQADRVPGQLSRAEKIARGISDPGRRESALASVAAAAAAVGRLDLAETAVQSVVSGGHRAAALLAIAKAAERAGRTRLVDEALDSAEQCAPSAMPGSVLNETGTLPAVAVVAALVGRHDRAERIAHSIADPHTRATTWTRLIRSAAEAGHLDFAEAAMGRGGQLIDAAYLRREKARALLSIAIAAAGAGQAERAASALAKAEQVVAWWGSPCASAEVHIAAVDAARALDRPDIVADVVRVAEARAQAAHSGGQLRALTVMAGVLAGAGDLDRAGAALDRAAQHVDQIEPVRRPRALVKVAQAAVALGRFDQVAVLLEHAERLARSSSGEFDGLFRARKSAAVSAALAAAGRFDEAEKIARAMHNRTALAKALTSLAEIAAELGDFDRAGRFAESIQFGHGRAAALARVAVVAGRSGRRDHALAFLDRADQAVMTRPEQLILRFTYPFVFMAEAAAWIGQGDRAEEIAQSISAGRQRREARRRIDLAVAGKKHDRPDVPATPRAVADALRGGGWEESVRPLVALVPEAAAAILEELAAVSRAQEG